MKNTSVSVIREFAFHDKAGKKGVRKSGSREEVVNLCDYMKSAGDLEITGDTLIYEGVVVCLGDIQSVADIFQLFRDVAPRVDAISSEVSLDRLLIAIYKHKGWHIEVIDE